MTSRISPGVGGTVSSRFKRSYIGKCIAAAIGCLAFAGATMAATISSEDFEGGATGWTFNTTTNGGSTFTEFLGRFAGSGGSELISKDYALSGTQTQVTVAFDFYEIDSWDFEELSIFINGTVIATDEFKHNREDFSLSPAMSAQSLLFGGDDGNVNYGFLSAFPDQGYRYEFIVNTTGTNLSLGFGTNLSSPISDESWGIDNVLIVDNSIASVNGPSILLLMSATLLGIPIMRRRLAVKTTS